MSSKFLGSTFDAQNIASESTLEEMNNKLDTLDVSIINTPLPVTGSIVLGPITIEDVDFGLGVQTDDLSVSVTNHPSLTAVNLTQVGGSTVDVGAGTGGTATQRVIIDSSQDLAHDGVITDVDFGVGTQTDLLATTIDESLLVGTQHADANVKGIVLLARDELKTEDDVWAPLTINSFTGMLEVTLPGVSETSAREISGVDVEIGNGTSAGGVQRVVIANDNDPLEILDKAYLSAPFLYVLSGPGNTKEAIGDYDAVPTDFLFTSGSDNTFINRMVVYVQDTGVFEIGEYAGNAAFTNGIRIFYTQDGGSKQYWNAQITIKSNADYSSMCYDIRNDTDNFGGNNSMSVRMSFYKSGGAIYLPFAGDTFGVELSDDMTGLISHRFTIQGYVRGTVA